MAEMETDATFDETGTYRYTLSRRWADGELLRWVLLNPSTADAEQDDPTIRRCMGYAREWGFGGIIVLNLFALRSTDPRELYRHPEPVGPDNDLHIESALRNAPVVAGWGVHGALRGRGDEFMHKFGRACDIRILGMTKDGHPKHPLYLRKDAEPQPWIWLVDATSAEPADNCECGHSRGMHRPGGHNSRGECFHDDSCWQFKAATSAGGE